MNIFKTVCKKNVSRFALFLLQQGVIIYLNQLI